MPNPVKEIGWSKVYPVHCATTRKWFGEALGRTDSMDVFHWHGDTFSTPPAQNGSWVMPSAPTRRLHSASIWRCNATMIDDRCHAWQEEIIPRGPLPRSVQTPDQVAAATPDRLPALQQIAFRLYTTWIDGLNR